MGLSGLKLTIPAPASISRMTSGLSSQSKGKIKAMEEEPSTSQHVLLFMFNSLLAFSVGQNFCHATCARSLASLVLWNYGRTEHGGRRAIGAVSGRWLVTGIWWAQWDLGIRTHLNMLTRR
jgi:hypothetical protein